MTIRVLVADDQSMVRAGFRMLLGGEDDIEVVAEASNGLEAVEKAARFDPTVVLMDIRMPELDGLEATRRILSADKNARILVLTTFDLDEYVYRALRAGASGFVLKDEPPEQLFAAGYAACFHSALQAAARTQKVKITDTSVGSRVHIIPNGAGGFDLAVELEVVIPDVDAATARGLADAAHKICPYSNATRGNIAVNVSVTDD